MSETALHAQVATLARAHLENKIAESERLKTISVYDGKVLAVRRAPNGEQFVLRSFSDDAVNGLTRRAARGETEFPAVNEDFQAIFRDANLAVVPTSYVGRVPSFDDGEKTHLVSDYLASERMDSRSPLEVRKAAVGGLVRILDNYRRIPAAEVLQHDMFMVEGNAPVLVDVDPLMYPLDTPYWTRRQRSSVRAAYLNRIPGLIDDWSETPGETHELARVALSQLPEFILDEDRFLDNVADIHALTQVF